MLCLLGQGCVQVLQVLGQIPLPRLYRFDPRQTLEGKNPLHLDSKAPKIPFKEYAYNENRYRMLAASDPEAADVLMKEAQAAVLLRWKRYEEMAKEEVEPTA